MTIESKYYYDFEMYVECKTGDADAFATKWSDILTDSKISGLTSFTAIDADTYAKKLLTDYLQPKYWNSIIRISDTDYTEDGAKLIEDITADEKKELFSKVDLKLWFILAKTFDKYKYFLGLYDSQLATLFAGVNKTTYNNVLDAQTNTIGAKTNISRTNDSPQNGGDYSDDAHTSSINKENAEQSVDQNNNTRTGSIDVSSPAYEKFEKIQTLIHNLYEEWTKEFEGAFYDMED